MNPDPRPQIHRRRRAIQRLRSMTTGVAIAGLAGTAGFGILAAASWSGDPNATGSTTTSGANDTSGTGEDPSGGTSGGTEVAPNPGRAVQPPTVTTPRVKRGSGSGHASTGGSH